MKFTLAILAFIAPLSVAYFFSALTLPDTAPLDASLVKQIPTITSYDDTDGDGLSNRDENLWRTDWKNPDTDNDGFLDGEEVLSGHDPRKAGPNDFIDRSKNLTDEFSSLFIGGAFAGDIDPDDPSTYPVVGKIADEVIDEYERFAMTSQSDVDLRVVPDSTENLVAYINAIAPHLVETFPDSLRYAEDFLNDFGSADAERTRELVEDEEVLLAMYTQAELIQLEMDEFSQDLIAIQVPESMARPHLNFIVLLQSIAVDAQTSTQLDSDPLKALLANTSLASLLTRTAPGFVYDFTSTLEHTATRIFTEERESQTSEHE